MSVHGASMAFAPGVSRRMLHAPTAPWPMRCVVRMQIGEDGTDGPLQAV